VIRRAALVLALAISACSVPTSRTVYQTPPYAPLTASVSFDPPPVADGVARDAVIRITLDAYPDPDTTVFGPVLLRSGKGNFDFDLSVDLLARAIVVRPRALLQANTTYEMVLTSDVASLDGRRLQGTFSAAIDVGATVVGAPAPPAVGWAEVAPILTTCAPYCHSPVGASGQKRTPTRGLDLTGDPGDPVRGLIGVPSVGLTGTVQPLLRVAAGDSSRSVLLRKLLGGSRASFDPPYPEMRVDGRRMPLPLDERAPALDPLDDASLSLIQRWIDGGAPH
jgi:hypothetical protein